MFETKINFVDDISVSISKSTKIHEHEKYMNKSTKNNSLIHKSIISILQIYNGTKITLTKTPKYINKSTIYEFHIH